MEIDKNKMCELSQWFETDQMYLQNVVFLAYSYLGGEKLTKYVRKKNNNI